MINAEITNKTSTKVDTKNQKSNDFNKRAELEKELNIQRNQKNRKKGPMSSDIKMNQLNYYNEIAKNNIHFLMNNPTIKEIIRITSNESVFDQLKAKEESKDLSKFLDNLPLKRVERINYKGLEIGNMRKDLQNNNNKAYINKEKGKKLAGNLFEKRKREGSVKFIPVLTVDNLFNYKTFYQPPKKQSVVNTKNKNNFMQTNNESWLKKYKHKTHINNNKGNKSNINENNLNNKAISIINNYKEKNNNLDSARINSNEYKKDFDNEKQKDKQTPEKIMLKSEKPINSMYNNNIIISNKNNEFNYRNKNNFPRRTLSQNFSDNKYLFRKDFHNLYNKENRNETSVNQDKLRRHNISSNNNLSIHNSIPDQKGGSVIILNNRRSNANTNNIQEIREIKVLKKQDLTKKNITYESKVNMNNNNPTRIKVTKVLNV